MEWITENLLLNIGGMGLATLALFLLWYVFKGYQKVLGNHLHDAHQDKQADIISRNENTKVLQKLCDKIDNIK